MAQKRKGNKKKKWVFGFIMLVLLVAAATVAYLVWDSYFKEKDRKTDSGQQETQRVEEKEKEKLEEIVLEAKEEEPSEDEGKKVVQYEGEDPNRSEGLSGVVTYAGVNGDKLMIRVNIDQFLDDGECVLSLIRNEATIYSDTASVVGSAATATCEGFDVPVAQLGNGGVEIKIMVNAGEKTGIISGRTEL